MKAEVNKNHASKFQAVAATNEVYKRHPRDHLKILES